MGSQDHPNGHLESFCLRRQFRPSHGANVKHPTGATPFSQPALIAQQAFSTEDTNDRKLVKPSLFNYTQPYMCSQLNGIRSQPNAAQLMRLGSASESADRPSDSKGQPTETI